MTLIRKAVGAVAAQLLGDKCQLLLQEHPPPKKLETLADAPTAAAPPHPPGRGQRAARFGFSPPLGSIRRRPAQDFPAALWRLGWTPPPARPTQG